MALCWNWLPLSAEWSAQEIPYSVTGSYNYTSETGWNWMDLTSDGSVQLGVQDNSRIYRGDAAYLGVVPEGVVLGIAADEELEFVAAFKNDQYNENLTLTMIAGQKPLCRGRDPAADDPQLRLRTQENDHEIQTPCRCGAGGGSLADRLRRRGGSRCPRRLRRSCPKHRPVHRRTGRLPSTRWSIC